MSNPRLYLSLIPQGLIASMLEPEEFGRYYAVGTKVHARGEAIFFEVDPAGLPAGEFPVQLIEERCVPKADGSPKKSVYLAIYRVLSRVPVSALGKLYLVTKDGQTLALERTEYVAEPDRQAHLYQEFCPIDPMVVSCLEPFEFCRAITHTARPVHGPRIVFSQLSLRELAHDPVGGSANDLPYPNMQHLREILAELLAGGGACKRRAMVFGAAKAPKVQKALGGAVEHDAHAVEHVDYRRGIVAHLLYGGLVGQKIAAVDGVVQMFKGAVALALGVDRRVYAALGANRMAALYRAHT